ncbi:MAG: hypothetical protein U5J62_12060 [Desulfurivibrio sp.]|nr:hypothetical protein [Desulfurivibrio sp.]
MLNRAAVILKYKEPAVHWINAADPNPDKVKVMAEEVNAERTVYLISDEDGDGPEAVERWIKQNYQVLFESELEDWYTDPALWPQELSLELFRQWFEVECHPVVFDTVGGEIYDDGI